MKNYSKFLRFIAVTSIFAVMLNIARLSLAENASYIWLNWNLVLALLPLLFAWLAILGKRRWSRAFFVIAWLLILPNSPYLITDFIHLADVGPKSLLWFDAIMIFFYTLAGIGVWIVTMDSLKKHFRWPSWSVWFVALLTGYGIYLGRYIRFNTWDVVTNPIPLIQTIGDTFIHPSAHTPVVMMTLVFAGLLGFLYFSVINTSLYEKTKN